MQICEENQRCRKGRWVKNHTILLKLIFQKSQSHKKWPENIFCQYNDYRTCAILTRSCLEATLDYKLWILGLKRVSYSFFIYLVLWPQIKKGTVRTVNDVLSRSTPLDQKFLMFFLVPFFVSVLCGQFRTFQFLFQYRFHFEDKNNVWISEVRLVKDCFHILVKKNLPKFRHNADWIL